MQMYVAQFAKIQHNGAFKEVHIFVLCSRYQNICSVVIYIYFDYEVTKLDSERGNTLPLYALLQQLILHAFNYTAVTYGYFSLSEP